MLAPSLMRPLLTLLSFSSSLLFLTAAFFSCATTRLAWSESRSACASLAASIKSEPNAPKPPPSSLLSAARYRLLTFILVGVSGARLSLMSPALEASLSA